MVKHPQRPFIRTELDPGLLSTQFDVQTDWHVITGAPCSGKTTLIDQLVERGFLAVPEVARQCFERELAGGRTLDDINEDSLALQRQIKHAQAQVERELRASDVAFLDRALPDCFAFYRIFGVNPNEFLHECFRFRYASVFVLDRLPVQRSLTLGPEDAVAAGFVDEWIARDYRALGYGVVRVPVLPPEGRLAFILEKLPQQGRV